jgi:hypothetical protein
MRKEEQQTAPQHDIAPVGLDFRALVRPTECFSSPQEVLENQLLDVSEKRAILASWASDLYAVESIPGLRELPGSHATVAVSDILDALKALDRPRIDIASQADEIRLTGVGPSSFRVKSVFGLGARARSKKFVQALERQNR